MKVSVAIITYNHEEFIAKALDSILSQQTNFNFELIIGEDNSTDNTRNILQKYKEKYPEKINLIIRDQNVGMMANFIEVLSNCSGEYLALCEGDDYWSDNLKLQKQIDFLDENKDYQICFHEVNILKKEGLVKNILTREVLEITTVLDVAVGNFIHTPSAVIRYNFKIPKWFVKTPLGDWSLYMIAVSKSGKIKKLDDIMAVYRVHGESVWSSQSNYIKRKRTLDAINLFLDSKLYRPDIEKILGKNKKWLSIKIFKYIAKKEMKECSSLICKIVKTNNYLKWSLLDTFLKIF